MNIQIIKNPRVTEKGSNALAQNVYSFDVARGATKMEIKKTIFALYKVHPVKVNVLTVPTKKVTLRGRTDAGTKGGGRKALVYLKEGDKIEFV